MPAALAEASLSEPQVTIALPLPPPPVISAMGADSFELAHEAQTSSEAEDVERLQGVYQGQIRGRLSRVLEMAVAQSAGTSGHCEARVIQNERGDVMDVDLDACAFDARSPRHRSALRIREGEPGHPAGTDDVPIASHLCQRILCVAGSTDAGPSTGRHRLGGEDP